MSAPGRRGRAEGRVVVAGAQTKDDAEKGLDGPGSAMRDRYDVVVAGARCAGAATAMLLARRGLSVLVVDPLPRGRDALSTHALMRGGVLQLHRWGLLEAVRAAATPPVRTTTFHYGDETIAIPIKPADDVEALYAPRRTVLDPLLEDAAVAAGAHVVRGLAVVDVVRDAGGRVRGAVVAGRGQPGREVAAELLVGADGIRSRVARLVEAPIERAAAHATATVYGYWSGMDVPEGYHWLFRPGASAGAIPTNQGATLVFAALPAPVFEAGRRAGLDTIHERTVREVSPGLLDALGRARGRGPLRAFAGRTGFLRRSRGPGWALVGDAGYFRDPSTAHGITDAFRDAELLARAVVQGTEDALTGYQAVRDGVARPILDVTDRIASFDWTLDEVQELHLELSRRMNVGVEVVRSFDGEEEHAPAGDHGSPRCAWGPERPEIDWTRGPLTSEVHPALAHPPWEAHRHDPAHRGRDPRNGTARDHRPGRGGGARERAGRGAVHGDDPAHVGQPDDSGERGSVGRA